VWVDLAQSIDGFARRHPENALLVSYEDLVARTDATMARIMAFVGEPWDPSQTERALRDRSAPGLGDWKTYGRTVVDSASIGRWKNLSRETISRLGAICNPTLAQCGYDAIELEAPRSRDEARRRHEVGLLLQGLTRKPGRADAAVGPRGKRARSSTRKP
jgi:hypothetical protein